MMQIYVYHEIDQILAVYSLVILIGDISVDIETSVDSRTLYLPSLYSVGEIISSCFFNTGQ